MVGRIGRIERRRKTPGYPSLSAVYEAARGGDSTARKMLRAALTNLGCEHLAAGPGERWERSYRGLVAYVSALVGEYGMSEGRAFKEVLAEVNAARGYCNDSDL